MQQLRVGIKPANSCHPGAPAPALPGHTGQQGAASSLSHHSRSQEPSSGGLYQHGHESGCGDSHVLP